MPTHTPRPQVTLASLRRRLACMAYESLLLLGVIAVGFLAPLILLGMLFRLELPGWLEWLHLFVLLGLYFVWLWRRNGQTLAMQTWQLQVVDVRSGLPPTLAQSLLRYVVAWPSIVASLCGFGLLWPLVFDRDRQFMHDRVAGTCIVFNPKQPQEAE